MMFACLTAFAEEAAAPEEDAFVTYDGVLSIQAPNEYWVAYDDPNYWFAMTDGDDFVTISHLSNGEVLPAVMVANEEFSAVYHAFVSTDNEIFIIRGCAVEQEGLKDIMQAISTVKILKLDTKQAVRPVTPVVEFEVKPYYTVLYSTSRHLNIRSSWSVDSSRLGYLSFGEPVDVTGIVRLNGRNYGWCQVSFNGRSAYVSTEYLSARNPNTDPLEYDTQDPNAAVQPWEKEPVDRDTQDPNAAVQPWEEEPVDHDTQDPVAADPPEYYTQDPVVADPPEYDTQDSYEPAEPDEDPPVSEMQDPTEDGYI